jgi:hypothetical protein
MELIGQVGLILSIIATLYLVWDVAIKPKNKEE